DHTGDARLGPAILPDRIFTGIETPDKHLVNHAYRSCVCVQIGGNEIASREEWNSGRGEIVRVCLIDADGLAVRVSRQPDALEVTGAAEARSRLRHAGGAHPRNFLDPPNQLTIVSIQFLARSRLVVAGLDTQNQDVLVSASEGASEILQAPYQKTSSKHEHERESDLRDCEHPPQAVPAMYPERSPHALHALREIDSSCV